MADSNSNFNPSIEKSTGDLGNPGTLHVSPTGHLMYTPTITAPSTTGDLIINPINPTNVDKNSGAGNGGIILGGNDIKKHASLRKSLTERSEFGSFYTIKGDSIVHLGFDMPEDAVLVPDNKMAGRYALMFVSFDFDSKTEVKILSPSTDSQKAQDQAIKALDNSDNDYDAVRVLWGTEYESANRTVFENFVTYWMIERTYKDVATDAEYGTDTFYVEAEPHVTEYYKNRLVVTKTEAETKTETETETDKATEERVIKFHSLSEGLVYGVVYEPNVVDTHGDWADAETIERAAHDFLPQAMTNLDHEENEPDIEVVESFIAPVDYDINQKRVLKGSWVMVARVNDLQIRGQIEKGDYNGFSLEGTARRV